LRDFAIAALIVDGRQIDHRVSFAINPTSRQILENLTASRVFIGISPSSSFELSPQDRRSASRESVDTHRLWVKHRRTPRLTTLPCAHGVGFPNQSQ
jgi:hypothetical protein